MIWKYSLFKVMLEFYIHFSLKCWKHISMYSDLWYAILNGAPITMTPSGLETFNYKTLVSCSLHSLKTVHQGGDSATNDWRPLGNTYAVISENAWYLLCEKFPHSCFNVFISSHIHYSSPIPYIHTCLAFTHII